MFLIHRSHCAVIAFAVACTSLCSTSARAEGGPADGPRATTEVEGGEEAGEERPPTEEAHPEQPFDSQAHVASWARISYVIPTGRALNSNVGGVSESGVGSELDAGVTSTSFGTFFVGWQHLFLGLGTSDTSRALSVHEDRGLAGWRTVVNPIYMEVAAGYSYFSATTNDPEGKRISYGLKSFIARYGMGLGFRTLRDRATVSFGIVYTIAVALEDVSATRSGEPSPTTMPTKVGAESMFRGALSPEAAFQFAF